MLQGVTRQAARVHALAVCAASSFMEISGWWTGMVSCLLQRAFSPFVVLEYKSSVAASPPTELEPFLTIRALARKVARLRCIPPLEYVSPVPANQQQPRGHLVACAAYVLGHSSADHMCVCPGMCLGSSLVLFSGDTTV